MRFTTTEAIYVSRRRWLRHLGGVLATVATLPDVGMAAAREGGRRDIAIVVSDDGETTRKVLADVRRRIPRAQVVDAKAGIGRNSVVVAIGPAALRSAMAAGGDGPVLSIFTSSQVYRSILDEAGDRRLASTAIYAEPSPSAQLRLVSMLFKRPVHTAVVLGARTSFLEPVLQRAAAAAKVLLAIEIYGVGDSINRILSRAAGTPVILAIPDSQVYNTENLRTVLLTTYRNGQAVIGFSAALVRAGALATTYSEIEDIGAQLEELVAEYESSGRLPEPQFPKYFRSVINEDVARSLNLVIDDAARNFAQRANT
jgi:hypothetical protein